MPDWPEVDSPASPADRADRRFIRFRSASPNRHGRYPGVFGLVNSLAKVGCLTAEQERFRRLNNAWYHANLIDPSDVDPSVYDRDLHPGAAAWFKSSASHLIERVGGYLAILDAHGVAWVRAESHLPGKIIYDDPHQIVVHPETSSGPRR